MSRWCTGGQLVLSAVELCDARADARGGGIYLAEVEASLSAVHSYESEAERGGAIYVASGSVSLAGVQVWENEAGSDEGGGITLAEGSLEFVDTSWSENEPSDVYLPSSSSDYRFGASTSGSCNALRCR